MELFFCVLAESESVFIIETVPFKEGSLGDIPVLTVR